MTAEKVPWTTPTKHAVTLEPDAGTVEADVTPAGVELDRMILATSLQEAIGQAAFTSRRSLQVTIGASEIGGVCQRQIAYRAANVPACNFPDPLKALVGTGGHAAMAELFTRLDGGQGRYLVEEPVEYRGVPGTLDLYDRRRRMVLDWKFTTKAKITDVRRNGPPRGYIVQAQVYAAALIARGDPVTQVAIVYVPTNAELSDIYPWTTPVDTAVADKAIEEFHDIRGIALASGPDAVPPTPTRLCPWCAHYNPTATDTARACPDGYQKKGTT
jgi:hypothetical protein